MNGFDSKKSSKPLITLLLLILALSAIGIGVFAFGKGHLTGTPPSIAIQALGGKSSLVLGREDSLEISIANPQSGVCTAGGSIAQGEKSISVLTYMGGESRVLPAYASSKMFKTSLSLTSLMDKGLKEGEATLTLSAVDCSLFRKTASSTSTFTLDLLPPQVSVTSTQHYLNQGGADLALYSVSADTVSSGIQVGPYTFQGYKVPNGSEGARFAFFVFSHELPATTPVEVFAKDGAGNSTKITLTPAKFFPKTFKSDKIMVDDAFIANKVMAIIGQTKGATPQGKPLDNFIFVNNELRRQNTEFLRSLGQQSAETFFWKDAFHRLVNTAPEASFADYRTYYYNGEEVDKQVHLGFDLASFKNTPVFAAGSGKIVYADYLGIYGNTVIIDHGYGLTSLYGHLSEIAVRLGELVKQDQPVGKSGETGLAGGDHLHFSMLIQGVQTNPIEFWDQHWIDDHVYLRLSKELFGKN